MAPADIKQLATTLAIAKVSFVTLDLNGNPVFAVPSLNSTFGSIALAPVWWPATF